MSVIWLKMASKILTASPCGTSITPSIIATIMPSAWSCAITLLADFNAGVLQRFTTFFIRSTKVTEDFLGEPIPTPISFSLLTLVSSLATISEYSYRRRTAGCSQLRAMLASKAHWRRQSWWRGPPSCLHSPPFEKRWPRRPAEQACLAASRTLFRNLEGTCDPKAKD